MNVNLIDVVQSHIKWAGMVLVDEVSGKIVEKGAEYLISRLASAGVFLVTEQDLAAAMEWWETEGWKNAHISTSDAHAVFVRMQKVKLRRPFGDRIVLCGPDAMETE